MGFEGFKLFHQQIKTTVVFVSVPPRGGAVVLSCTASVRRDTSLLRRTRKYDQFGFDNLPDDDTDAMLVAAASQLEKRSADITQSLSKFNTSVAIKWQNYLAINKYVYLCFG